MSGALPDLGIRVDALGVEQAQAKIKSFGATIGKLPRDLNQTSRAARKVEVNFQKMSFAMFGASLAITGTVTSLSRLEKSALGVQRAEVALERGTDLVVRKQLLLNRILKNGERVTGELAAAQSELATAVQDITVKQEDLRIKIGEVSDTYINFAASLGSSVLFAVVAFISAIDKSTLSLIKNKLATVSNAVSMQFLKATAVQTSPALVGVAVASQATTLALIKTTLATQGLAAAARILLVNLGPVGIAFAAIGTVLTLLLTGALDFIPGIKAFRGALEPAVVSLDEAGIEMEQFNTALQGPKGGIKSIRTFLPTLASTTIQMEDFADATGVAAQNMAALGQVQAAASGSGTGGGGGRQVTVVVNGVEHTLTIPGVPGAGDFVGPPTGPATALQFTPANNITDFIDKLRQIQGFRSQTRATLEEILDLTKNMTEEAQRQIAQQFILENFAEGQVDAANRLLSLLISQNRQREKAAELSKEIDRGPLFNFLVATGQVGKQAIFGGRGAGGFLTLPGQTFGTGSNDRFSGFQSGPGSTITVNGQTFVSRANNPAFGKVFGGQDVNAINTFQGGGSVATGGGGGTGAGQTQATLGKNIQQGLQFVLNSILRTPPRPAQGRRGARAGGGGTSNIQGFLANNPAITKSLENVMLANSLGIIDGPFALSLGVQGAIELADAAIASLTQQLQTAATNLGLKQGTFGKDIFEFSRTNRKTGRGFDPVKTVNRIDTVAEFRKEIARINFEAERQAFIAEAERRIDRELRFRIQQAANPGSNLGSGGTQLFMDIQPLADALLAILSGESHKQFISLLGDFKFR